MTTYLYPCHVFQQRSGGDELIIFAAPAGEIKEWAGVPRKHFDYQHGFQRTLAEGRVEDLAEFYAESEKNFSPTSVVIALKSDQYSLMELDESPSEAFRQLQLDVIEYENESTDVLIEQCIQIRVLPRHRRHIRKGHNAGREDVSCRREGSTAKSSNWRRFV
jgi:hypothetical protein